MAPSLIRWHRNPNRALDIGSSPSKLGREDGSIVRLEEFNYCIHGYPTQKKHTWDLKAGVTRLCQTLRKRRKEETGERGRKGERKTGRKEGKTGRKEGRGMVRCQQ